MMKPIDLSASLRNPPDFVLRPRMENPASNDTIDRKQRHTWKSSWQGERTVRPKSLRNLATNGLLADRER
jgi:hypothetical protein